MQRIKFLQRWDQWLQPALYVSLSVILVAGIIYVRPWAVGNLPPANLNLVDIYSNYEGVGEFMNGMDVNTPVILGGPDAATNSIIPSLTLKFVPLVFRVESGGEQTQLWKSLMAENLSPAERFSRFQENNIEYLLVRGDPDWMGELLSTYPDNFSLLFADRRLKLYRINQKSVNNPIFSIVNIYDYLPLDGKIAVRYSVFVSFGNKKENLCTNSTNLI